MCAQVLAHLDVLLPSLFDALAAPGDRVVAEALSVQATIAADDPAQFRTLMRELLDRCAHRPSGLSVCHSNLDPSNIDNPEVKSQDCSSRWHHTGNMAPRCASPCVAIICDSCFGVGVPSTDIARPR